ncbi:MAG: alpha/beta hydrolase [Thermoleophilaceae bacterium]|nr:alpha/beta hydrolase [Thermoleophilaceae bacterium]
MGALAGHTGGSGPPLLLIHGTGLTWRTWLPVIPILESAREVYAIDLPGFGDSPPAERYDIAGLADGLEDHLDTRGIERIAVAGNSLGGWLALELAARGRASAVAAISPAGCWTPREREWTRRVVGGLARPKRPPDWAWKSAPARRVLMSSAMVHGDRLPPEECRRYAAAYADTPGFWPVVRDTFSEVFRGFHQVRCPVSVLFGAGDWVVVRRAGPRIARLIPGARHEVVPGCGHVPMVDDPEGIAARILATC